MRQALDHARAAAFDPGPFEEVELDAGHWLIQEEPGRVVAAVMDHLRAQAL